MSVILLGLHEGEEPHPTSLNQGKAYGTLSYYALNFMSKNPNIDNKALTNETIPARTCHGLAS